MAGSRLNHVVEDAEVSKFSQWGMVWVVLVIAALLVISSADPSSRKYEEQSVAFLEKSVQKTDIDQLVNEYQSARDEILNSADEKAEKIHEIESHTQQHMDHILRRMETMVGGLIGLTTGVLTIVYFIAMIGANTPVEGGTAPMVPEKVTNGLQALVIAWATLSMSYVLFQSKPVQLTFKELDLGAVNERVFSSEELRKFLDLADETHLALKRRDFLNGATDVDPDFVAENDEDPMEGIPENSAVPRAPTSLDAITPPGAPQPKSAPPLQSSDEKSMLREESEYRAERRSQRISN